VFGLVLLIPAILALAVTQALSTEILAILLGAVASYIFGRPSGGNSGGGRPELSASTTIVRHARIHPGHPFHDLSTH
jgi:hypothetical protein